MGHPITKVLIAAGLIGCAHWVVVSATGWQASLGETNYQNNMIRADVLLNEPPGDVILVGSSITGRLLPAYFPSGEKKVVNLGLDGCTLLTGLEMIQHMETQPEILLFECMRDHFEPQPNDVATLGIIDNPVFKSSKWLPVLRPSWRPSSVLYTRTKLSRELAISNSNPTSHGRKLGPQKVRPPRNDNTGDPWKTETMESIALLADQGVRCIPVRIPTSADLLASDYRPHDFGDDLASTFGMPVIDTTQVIRQRGLDIFFTDGLHLRSDSARLISEIIWDSLSGMRVEKTSS